jgi:hypothetical protein
MVFTNFGCLFVAKIQNKISACFYEIICKNSSSNPLQVCKFVPKAACDPENCSKSWP